MKNLKNYLIGFLFLASTILSALFFRQKRKTLEAKEDLQKVLFGQEKKEADTKYENAKNNADKLVDDYHRMRSTFDSSDSK